VFETSPKEVEPPAFHPLSLQNVLLAVLNIVQLRLARSPFAVHRSPFAVHRSPFAVHRSPFAGSSGVEVTRPSPST
jgi:hypothetical protein